MNTFRTQDGDTYKARSPQELIDHMRRSGRFVSEQNEAEFMRGFAQRFKEWNGSVVRCDTPENFVEDLLKTGFLTEIN